MLSSHKKGSYIDFHTHLPLNNDKLIQIISIEKTIRTTNIQFLTMGIHPWYIRDNYQQKLNYLENTIKNNKSIIAIGECGLDKSCKTNLELQKKVFIHQIKLAQKHNLPLIIHSVKAYNEIITILKKHKLSTPVIFHGFSGSKELALQLLLKGYYLSLGRMILKSKHREHILDIFKKHQMKILLESDSTNQKKVDITKIYSLFSDLCKISIKEVKERQMKIFTDIFGELNV